MDGEADPPKSVDLKATIQACASWRKTRKGWWDLLCFLAFFGLFCAILILQIQPQEIFALDEALRQRVVDEGGKLQDVAVLEDLYSYLNDQIMPSVFPDKWYNDETMSRSDSEYILSYNKLVGGLLIVQERGIRQRPCRVPYISSFRSAYEDFYPYCYVETRIEESVALVNRTHDNVTQCPNAVEWKPGVAAPPQEVNATRADASLGNFWQSFCFDQRYSGFAAFLALADGNVLNTNKLQSLQTYSWLDRYTRKVDVKFAVYNNYYKYFLFVKITFNYSPSGIWLQFGEDDGVSVQIKGVRLEPYRIGPQYRDPGVTVEPDLVLLILEVVFLAWLFSNISAFIRSLLDTLVREGWSGREEVDPATGALESKGGLMERFTDMFTLIDAANYATMVAWVCLRISYVQLLLDPKQLIKVPTDKYQPILEKAAARISDMLFYNFINVMLMLLRCFKYYRFQPRLAIINKTLSIAAVDLYHFMGMFLTVLTAYAVMANTTFGVRFTDYSTLARALPACFIAMMSGGGSYQDKSNVGGSGGDVMAAFYYLTFVLLVVIVLLNMLLAILVDSYADAMDAMKEQYGEDDDAVPSIFTDMHQFMARVVWRSGPLTDEVLVAACAVLRRRGLSCATHEEVAAAARELLATSGGGGGAVATAEHVDNHPAVVLYNPEEDEEKEEDSAPSSCDVPPDALEGAVAPLLPAATAADEDPVGGLPPTPAVSGSLLAARGGGAGSPAASGDGVELLAALAAVLAEHRALKALRDREVAAGRLASASPLASSA